MMSASPILACQQNNQDDIDLQPGLKLKKQNDKISVNILHSSFVTFEELAELS